MDGCVAGQAICLFRSEAAVPGRRRSMTAEAEVSFVLEFQHVPVGRPMDFVTNRTSLDPGGFVLIDERPAFIGMAFEALFLLEPSQPFPRRRFMGIVAGCAGENALLEAVPLVELEFGKNILVAERTVLVRARLKKSRPDLFSMDGMAGRAVERRFVMRAGEIAGSVLGVTGQTAFRLVAGQVFGPESKDVPFSAFLSVLGSLAVASRAAGGCSSVGGQVKSLNRSLMADAAGLRVFNLKTRPGAGQEDKRRGG